MLLGDFFPQQVTHIMHEIDHTWQKVKSYPSTCMHNNLYLFIWQDTLQQTLKQLESSQKGLQQDWKFFSEIFL